MDAKIPVSRRPNVVRESSQSGLACSTLTCSRRSRRLVEDSFIHFLYVACSYYYAALRSLLLSHHGRRRTVKFFLTRPLPTVATAFLMAPLPVTWTTYVPGITPTIEYRPRWLALVL